MVSSWCWVLNRSATARAYGSSLNESFSKPIEKVWSGCDEVDEAKATTALESMPPLSRNPSGTSTSPQQRLFDHLLF